MKIFLVPLADLADTGEVGEEGVLVRGNETFGETFGLLEVIDDYGEAALVGGLRYHHLEHCLGGDTTRSVIVILLTRRANQRRGQQRTPQGYVC